MNNNQDYDKLEFIPVGRAKDLTKQVFGRLTVLGRAPNHVNDKKARWWCKCSCGNIIETSGACLIKGEAQSCGCLCREKAAERCKKIGKLKNYKDYSATELNINPYYEFISPTDEIIDGCRIWNVKCRSCGKTYQACPVQLISETRRRGSNPCPCYHNISKGVLKIEELLQQKNFSFIKEYTYKDCVSLKGNLLRFDFLVNDCYLIEYDGEQHFYPTTFGGQKSGIERLEESLRYDSIKNIYCLSHNIPLIRIPYTYYADLCIEDLIPETSRFLVTKEDDYGEQLLSKYD